MSMQIRELNFDLNTPTTFIYDFRYHNSTYANMWELKYKRVHTYPVGIAN